MSAKLDVVPRRIADGSHSALDGVSYPELVSIVERMEAEDPRIVFDSLRPMGDELWNFIDGQRSVAAVVEAVCFEFDFDLDPILFMPLIEGMAKAGLIDLNPPEA